MKISVQKSSNRLDNMFKQMMEADKQYVDVGHFESQGKHYSGMTYPALLKHWANHPTQPKRILVVTAFALKNLKIGSIQKAKERWFKDRDAKKLLNGIGVIIRDIEKSLFGVVSKNMTADSTNTPLVETHDLKEKTTYKTSLGGK